MIKIENLHVYGWEAAIRGMRNPMNSWDRSDTVFAGWDGDSPIIGENDHKAHENTVPVQEVTTGNFSE